MKKALRSKLIKLRKAQTTDEVSEKSNLITHQILNSNLLAEVKSVHLYYAINKEVDTRELIETLWLKGINVILPRTILKTHDLVNYEITSFSQLEKTTFNMLEPKVNCPVFHGDPDIIFVPGVGFDKRLNRIGYGGGFYDKFLMRVNSNKVALAYELQILDSLPIEEHDVKMDMIVTEKKIYNGEVL